MIPKIFSWQLGSFRIPNSESLSYETDNVIKILRVRNNAQTLIGLTRDTMGIKDGQKILRRTYTTS